MHDKIDNSQFGAQLKMMKLLSLFLMCLVFNISSSFLTSDDITPYWSLDIKKNNNKSLVTNCWGIANKETELNIIALNLAFMEREWNAPLEKYKDIFGKPGTGAHAHRIANIAIVDVLITLLVAAIIGFLSYRNWIDKLLMTILMFFGLFILSIFIHRLFGVHTTITDAFFP
jgi:hypothetical protein